MNHTSNSEILDNVGLVAAVVMFVGFLLLISAPDLVGWRSVEALFTAFMGGGIMFIAGFVVATPLLLFRRF